MTTNWLRACTIVYPGGTYTLDGSNFNTQLQCRFQMHGATHSTPNTAVIKFTNPDPALRSQVRNWEKKEISVSAGYIDNNGLLFKGSIVQAFMGRESPTDTVLVLSCGSLYFPHKSAVVNKTFPPGSTQQDHVKEAIKVMNAIEPISIGFIGPNLSSFKYPRAVSIFKRASSVLEGIAKSNNANHSYQNGKLHLVRDDESVPGTTVVLNSQTGLIGTPSQTLKGIIARCLINPNICVNGLVQIDQKSINAQVMMAQGAGDVNVNQSIMPSITEDGVYKVIQIEVDADTRGTPWYMDLTLIPTANGAQIGKPDLKSYGAAGGTGLGGT